MIKSRATGRLLNAKNRAQSTYLVGAGPDGPYVSEAVSPERAVVMGRTQLLRLVLMDLVSLDVQGGRTHEHVRQLRVGLLCPVDVVVGVRECHVFDPTK